MQNNSNNTTRRRSSDRYKSRYSGVQIIVFFLVFYIIAVTSWIIPLRPSYSESEKRDLEKFPAFSFSTLMDGSFFDSINTWFSDTFPFREGFIQLNTKFKGLYGKASAEIHGEVETGDEIPDAPMSEPEVSASPETEVSSEPVSSLPPEIDLEGVPTQTLGALLIVGDSAYEYYNFVQSTADKYISAVNSAANQLAGTATVYDMVVPLSIDILLPESFRKDLNTSNQQNAIDYMYKSMNDKVKTVDLYSALRAKSDEYIYFRTDHHWTALGAYYAYDALARVKNTAPAPLSWFKETAYEGYLGSFYSESGRDSRLGANPDTVYTYEPPDTNDITVTTSGGVEYNAQIVANATNYDTGSKYIAFIEGDNPYSVIHNPEKTDGSTCVIVKESFGNAFVPFLVADYQHIYVVDYRYYHKISSKTIPDLAIEVGAQDVIFMNNLSATRNSSLMSYFANLCG